MRGESMCCVPVSMEWKNVRELLTLQIIIIIFIIDDWSKYEIGLRLIWQFGHSVWVCRHFHISACCRMAIVGKCGNVCRKCHAQNTRHERNYVRFRSGEVAMFVLRCGDAQLADSVRSVIISTFEDETCMLSRNVGHHPATRHHIPEERRRNPVS